MGRKRNDLQSEIDDITDDWIKISRTEEPAEWQAWIDWRKRYAGANAEPNGLTVPTPFPPMTVHAAKEYLDVVRKIRILVDWKAGTKLISSDPCAWRAPMAAE